ncbi:MAG TPA: hypothetical protein VHY20_04830 [Pirellulales bacterium]|jgi:integrase|nr:hypothetical protein [Pirellulales bacterium]
MSSAASRPQFRLFEEPSADSPQGDGSDDGLTPDSTLSEFFERYVIDACLANSEPRNIKQLRESLGYWRRFTGDPPLRSITQRTTAHFVGVRDKADKYVSGLRSLPGRKPGEPISPNTVRKHCVEIQRLLNLAGPAIGKLRDARGLLERVPWIAKPAKVVREVRDNYSIDELKLVLEACKLARHPRRLPHGLTPARFFHALYVFDFHVGVRIGTLTAVRYSWLGQDIFGEPCLNVPARFVKGKRKDESFFVTPDALAAIEAIRTPGRDVVFPWPHSDSWLQACRRKLLARSKLPEGRRLGFHGVRKGFATELGLIDAHAVSMAAGHAGKLSAVTQQHYLGRKVMIEAMKRLPSIVERPSDPDAELGAYI